MVRRFRYFLNEDLRHREKAKAATTAREEQSYQAYSRKVVASIDALVDAKSLCDPAATNGTQETNGNPSHPRGAARNLGSRRGCNEASASDGPPPPLVAVRGMGAHVGQRLRWCLGASHWPRWSASASVLTNSLPPAVHFVEIRLRGRVVLLRGALIPLHCFAIVLGDPSPIFVQDSEFELRQRIVPHRSAPYHFSASA